MNVNPGEMTKRIIILERVSTTDAEGYQAAEYSVVRRCWAKLTRASGTELLKANADFAQVQLRFLTYAPSVELSRKMVISYSEQLYEITYLNQYGDDKAYVEIWCKAMTLEG